jgi:hypothetical protein
MVIALPGMVDVDLLELLHLLLCFKLSYNQNRYRTLWPRLVTLGLLLCRHLFLWASL